MTHDQSTSSRWRQLNLWCADWQTAERMAVTHLRPLLTEAEDTGSITSWWFTRKGNEWRLRLLPDDGPDEAAYALLAQVATALTDRGAIRRHAEVSYEPEIHAFGGADAMAVAHRLFHADSRHILQHLAIAQPGTDYRRELGVRLTTRMMLAARQDWYEQGDIWVRLAEHRTTDVGLEPTLPTLAAMQQLITAEGDTDGSPLASAPGWPSSVEHAGRALADLSERGNLTRGLRAVLAHHLLFAFNRLGVSVPHQRVLATAASRVIFQREITPDAVAGPAGVGPTVTNAVPTGTMTMASDDPQRLREALVAHIDGLGTFRTSQVIPEGAGPVKGAVLTVFCSSSPGCVRAEMRRRGQGSGGARPRSGRRALRPAPVGA